MEDMVYEKVYVQVLKSTYQMCGAWSSEPNLRERHESHNRWMQGKEVSFEDFAQLWEVGEVTLHSIYVVPNDKEILMLTNKSSVEA